MEIDTPTGSDAGNLPAGVEPSKGVESPSPEATPSIIDLDDNALIRVKGSDKPVKFSDHVKGFQAQFTRASQRAAALERQLAEERAEKQRLAQAQRQPQTAPADPNADIYASLRALPYLSGEDAVTMVQSIGEQLRQRDMVLLGTLKELQKVQQLVGGLHQTHTTQAFDAKIQKYVTDGGYDPEWTEFAKELYLAYEPGEELDAEFPQILAQRIEQAERLAERKRALALNKARKQPFVPGKGGQGHPSKPLEIKANATSREIADQLFGSWNGSDT